MTDIKNLKEIPRFQAGVCKLDNFSIEYVDSLSTYYDHMDIFEKRVYHFEALTEAPRILDAGGYIGVQTLYFKKVYPKSKITVFEPDTQIFQVLKSNLEKNGFSDVDCVNAGLGKERKKIKLYSDGADAGSMIETHEGNAVEVDLVKLSDYLNEPVDLLKMNIEGMESEVFEEIESKLHNIREIIFEYHCFYNFSQSLGRILNMFDNAQFRYVVTDATSAKVPTPFTLPDNYKYFNLVYAKNNNWKAR